MAAVLKQSTAAIIILDFMDNHFHQYSGIKDVYFSVSVAVKETSLNFDDVLLVTISDVVVVVSIISAV